ncbi:hypothetical protein P9239_04050 [Caballeronia sp. LZ062]|uniref:hypothetical protein n=1 Tax=unclassified Caballeronia TaxID=2646786 RepID=UPI00285A337A|nr:MULTISPECIES: hypothetical protein [unclassified Caballeronia]MDR5857075.1 hypothetical protein [Caballeronia sp. LZ050]MDR5869529.1 hypothetical protein [Caballeronia sp. LZ062]
MPDSAVPRNPDASSDAHVPPAKAGRRAPARTAQRVAQLRDAIRPGETLDLFAEDAERATQQAKNTDIRQGTFEGFELPEVFLAAVESSAKRRTGRAAAPLGEPESAPMQGELIADAPDTSDESAKLFAIATVLRPLRTGPRDQCRPTVASRAFPVPALILCAMLVTLAVTFTAPVALDTASADAFVTQ